MTASLLKKLMLCILCIRVITQTFGTTLTGSISTDEPTITNTSAFVKKSGFIVVNDAPRNVVKILTVANGGQWGDWHGPHFCADGSFAVGYNMKIELNQNAGDDSGLNAILLQCEFVEGSRYGGQVGSGEGTWGNWMGWTRCDNQAGAHDFLTSFSLQVEPSQACKSTILTYITMERSTCLTIAFKSCRKTVSFEEFRNGGAIDDTSANYVKFTCRDLTSDNNQTELAHPPGHGLWGSYGGWSESCPINSAICGIQTRIEASQHGGDDTALNDVKFFCCE
ncbi:hypothetical protein CHS0354_005981 [Potamilus streckersoni]|uniref:Vitelline membrane outer layer protein 1 homolog n=1 Tax=Potamilus streckersoni TaxID=2493646 RepID=A0AAE0RP68_9BIVA|nr:hypothetical protein CHS0354_005981 [Potamilus streckersoni]